MFDSFKKIDGRTIYREITEIIKAYRLRFEIIKEDGFNRKYFYLPEYNKSKGHDHYDGFIKLYFGVFEDTFVPVSVEIARNVSVYFTEQSGSVAKPCNLVEYVYGESWKYKLSKWKRDKKKLIEALDYAIERYAERHSDYIDWINGNVGTDEIHFESLKKLPKKENKQ